MDSPLSVVSYDHNVAILVAPPAIMTIYRDTTIRLNGTKSKSLVLLCNVKPKSESLIIAYCHDRKNKYMRARKHSFLHFQKHGLFHKSSVKLFFKNSGAKNLKPNIFVKLYALWFLAAIFSIDRSNS